jgi:diguanylate cyclase (GGDEF)-like protein
MLISKLKETGVCNIESLGFEGFKDAHTLEGLKKYTLSNLFIAVENTFYNTNKEEILQNARTVFDSPFTNFIFVYDSPSFLTDPGFIQGSRHCFYLRESDDIDIVVINFASLLVSLFEKSVISSRLTDYIRDSFREVVYSEILIKKNKEIERLNEELERRNKIDYLTNLYNRNALFDFLNCEWERTSRDLWRITNSSIDGEGERRAAKLQRKHDPLGTLLDHIGVFSVMMIDIDHFKTVNDTYGHLAGDKVLKTAGKLFLNDNILRKSDISCRYGGEEFIVILPETSSLHALGPALRLSETFSSIAFFDNQKTFNVTLSVGISEFHPGDKSSEDIIQRADKALYHAKKHGRGTVVVYEQLYPENVES